MLKNKTLIGLFKYLDVRHQRFIITISDREYKASWPESSEDTLFPDKSYSITSSHPFGENIFGFFPSIFEDFSLAQWVSFETTRAKILWGS